MSRRNRIVAVSHAVANRFQGQLTHSFRGRVETIYNAVDLERFYPDAQSRKEIRRALGIDAARVIGIVGQLTPRKGQLELIEAFAETSREFPDTVLLIVGEPLFNRDAEYAKSLADSLPGATRGHARDHARAGFAGGQFEHRTVWPHGHRSDGVRRAGAGDCRRWDKRDRSPRREWLAGEGGQSRRASQRHADSFARPWSARSAWPRRATRCDCALLHEKVLK
jgi:glycosyltransferase involved in cell wall biosynthesis